MSEREIKVFESIETLNEYAAKEFISLARQSIAARGHFTVALSGGSTPKKLYALLASEDYRSQIEWSKIQFFFGDERLVAPDSEESNYRMANESLFSKIEIPAANIHRFHTEEAVKFINSDYPGCGFGWMDNLETEVRKTVERMNAEVHHIFDLPENEFPRFDLIFLGMGTDGHTASLFPETEALKETRKTIVENYVPKFEAFRLTLTFPAINNARNVVFLIAGADKAEVLKEVLQEKSKKYPAQSVEPTNGKLQFLLDEKAAKLIDNF